MVLYTIAQAREYSKLDEKSYSWNFIEKPLIKKYLKPIIKGNTRALDAGCGTGRTTKLLLELGVKPYNLIGTDDSLPMLDYAKKNLPNVKLVRSDLARLKQKNRSVDVVLCNMVFHHLREKDYEKAIRIFSKLLVKGGCLFYITLHPLRYIHDYAEYHSGKAKFEETAWGTKIKYYHKTVSKYLSVLLDFGFELRAIEEPFPVGKNAKEDQEKYQKHSSIPTRLMVMAVKT